MTETKVEDILIPLLTKSDLYLDEETFNKKCRKIRTEELELYLTRKFGFSINFIHIIPTQELDEVIKDLEAHEQFYKNSEPSQHPLLPPHLFRRILNYLKAPNNDNKYLFSWDKIPGKDNTRFIEFLVQKFSIEWIKEAKINKNDDGTTISVTNDKNILSLTLNNEKTNVTLEIDYVRTDKFIVKTENGKLNIYNNNFDSLDDLFLDDEMNFHVKRIIFISKYPKSIKLQNKKISCRLFINVLEIKSKNGNKLPYHIISVIPTSYNLKEIDGDELYKLSNEQIIDLTNYDFSKCFNDFNEKVQQLFKKDTFVAIQLWNKCWKDKQDNIFDAKHFVRINPYYFYSILTLDKDVFRRTYENIMDVLGWCQSESSVYFDISHSTTCLELTTKPRIDHVSRKYESKFFDETGHDSEQFRIWEFLALQHKLLIEIKNDNLNNVDDLTEELDMFYNFNIFTKKDGKREKWIWYVKYLQKISGIDSYYQDYKNRVEIKNKEHEQKLQKLNILIIVSIFASFGTLLLSPIYNSLFSIDNGPPLNLTFSSDFKNTSYFENIFKKPDPEIKAINLALILTCVSYLYINKSIIGRYINKYKIGKYVKKYKIEKYLKNEEYSIIIVIILTIILVLCFIQK